MINTLISVFFGLSSLNSISKSAAVTDTVLVVRLSSSSPVLNEKGKLQELRNHINLLYFKDYTVVMTPYKIVSEDTPPDSLVKLSGIIDHSTQYNYHIYSDDDQYGLKYRTLKPGLGKKFSVDSLLKHRAFKAEALYDPEKDQLRKTIKNSTGSWDLLDVYEHIDSEQRDTYDSVEVYYSEKLKGLKYTLSTDLDQLHNSKVCKIIFIFNSKKQQSPDLNFQLQQTRMVLEIEKIKIVNDDEIITFIQDQIKSEYKFYHME